MNFSKGGSSKGKKPMVSKSAPNSCPNCGKAHGGRPCLFGSNVCFTCGQTGHMLETVLKRSRQVKEQSLQLKGESLLSKVLRTL
ncbi:Transposon Ty3-G Gag-Pol polyprotein [Senna tora]|uniref:Transposon Ty3-G Gag-Pol polyprotein n=1 Tax=Senna tora TaxID=362788 RepID=A0A834T4U1_9FABA|nr:Transposon Ty3-G Gag-Pol polyprotein [Senna tora]